MKSPLTIKEMHKIAESKGGLCLSSEYINTKTKLKWKCKEEHTWNATPGAIKYNETWCPDCAAKKLGNATRLTIDEMQALAKSREGKCLSKKYVNSSTNLKWQCSEGHIWKAMPMNIKVGKWCPYCAGKLLLSIDEMRDIALERGGKCLSDKYINSRKKLIWECVEGHTWEATPNNVKRGTWCPVCKRIKMRKLTNKFR